MESHPRTNNRTIVLLALPVILLAIGIAFDSLVITGYIPILPLAGLENSSGPSVGQTAPAPTLTASPALQNARAVLAWLRDEVIPREGETTEYGVKFDQAGYQTLIQWNQDFKVEASYAIAFESLDLRLPCCDWSMPSRNEKTNCGCGHHQALEGLSKRLLSAGWNRDTVQREATKWNRYLYPKEALRAEMEKRAQLDPEIKTALEELKARGEC